MVKKFPRSTIARGAERRASEKLADTFLSIIQHLLSMKKKVEVEEEEEVTPFSPTTILSLFPYVLLSLPFPPFFSSLLTLR